ncbi:MAG: glycosyltransferase family 39 protein [Flavobacteriales bacterium]|nr:glycosyltransferase family 39 protein [Flavobacteriales bacterium]
MFDSYFSSTHQVVLGVAIGIIIIAAWLEWNQKQNWALVALTLGALVLRLFAATLDPFLNQWDECFHALVAKRMLEDPFTPRLFAEGILSTSANWTQAGLWLHKPPFFLWQIAASLAAFGVEPWAVRIPSALWLTALVPVTYRMGQLLAEKHAGWIAALFTTCSYYLLELTAGAINTDHNDATFIATVACSWWALLELWKDGRLRWALLVGLFAACAILTKLFVGTLVFVPWFAVAIYRNNRGDWKKFFIGALISMVLCLLWFGSIALRFPDELEAQWLFDTSHMTETVEGHSGGLGFHFLVIQQLLPPFTWWLVIPVCILLIWRTTRKEHRVFVVVILVAVHGAFAWANTKMVSFTMVLLPIYFIGIGAGLVALTNTLIMARHRYWLLMVSSTIIAAYSLNIDVLQYRHTLASPPKEHQKWRQQQIEAMPVLAKLAAMVPNSGHTVVYNIPAIHHIQFMFATGIEATDQMPVKADVESLHRHGFTIYAIQDGEPLEHFPSGIVVIRDEVLKFPDVGRPK